MRHSEFRCYLLCMKVNIVRQSNIKVHNVIICAHLSYLIFNEKKHHSIMSNMWNDWVGHPMRRTFIGRNFNSWLGSNLTHVRNDSGHDILVIISSERNSVSSFSISLQGVINVNLVQGVSLIRGLIRPGCVFPFERTNSIDYWSIRHMKRKRLLKIYRSMRIYLIVWIGTEYLGPWIMTLVCNEGGVRQEGNSNAAPRWSLKWTL